MGLRRAIVLVALMEVTWSLNVMTIGPETVSTDASAHPEPAEENTEQVRKIKTILQSLSDQYHSVHSTKTSVSENRFQ